MGDEWPRGTLGTVRNAVSLLELLSHGPAYQQLTELAERSGLSLPTVHRLLRSLALSHLVEQDPDSLRYSLGPQLVRLSERYLARLPVVRTLAPYLVELRDATKATILVSVLVDGSVISVDRVDGEDTGGVFRETSRLRPALDTAAGRVLLAHSPPELWADVLAAVGDGGKKFSSKDQKQWAETPSIVVADDLNRRVEVAVPVFGEGVRAAAALSAVGGSDTLREERLDDVASQLLQAAGAATRGLGHG
jgi:IclR family acetate operon transcriptional repressor